jgi:hypothetical protein
MYDNKLDFDEDILSESHEIETPKNKKNINKEMFILKIKLLFLKLQHFPTLLKDFLRYTLLSLLKLWGIVLACIILAFLYFTDSYSSIYYKVYISMEKSKVDRIESSIARQQIELKEAKENLNCYKKQFSRIANSEEVLI